MYRIGWFSTGRDQAARELLKTIYLGIKTKEIPAEIAFVFSNRAEGESLESDKFFKLVKTFGLPLITFSSAKFKPDLRAEGKGSSQVLSRWREDFDKEVRARLQDFEVGLIILAGYMLIVSPVLCRNYPMINLHPALPGGPVGTWQEVILKLIEEKAEETGAMMHLVTEELDKGPALTYFSFSLQDEPLKNLWGEDQKDLLFEEIRAQEVKKEMPLIFLTLKKLAESKLRIEKEKVFAGPKILKDGYCLNREIEAYLRNLTRT